MAVLGGRMNFDGNWYQQMPESFVKKKSLDDEAFENYRV